MWLVSMYHALLTHYFPHRRVNQLTTSTVALFVSGSVNARDLLQLERSSHRCQCKQPWVTCVWGMRSRHAGHKRRVTYASLPTSGAGLWSRGNCGGHSCTKITYYEVHFQKGPQLFVPCVAFPVLQTSTNWPCTNCVQGCASSWHRTSKAVVAHSTVLIHSFRWFQLSTTSHLQIWHRCCVAITKTRNTHAHFCLVPVCRLCTCIICGGFWISWGLWTSFSASSFWESPTVGFAQYLTLPHPALPSIQAAMVQPHRCPWPRSPL